MADNDATVAAVVRKAWSDPAFKAALLADSNHALAQIGIEAPAGVTIKVVADEPGVRHYVLPQQPASLELSDEHLDVVVGGVARAKK